MKKQKTNDSRQDIFGSAVFQRFQQQVWYKDWRRAMEDQNLDIEAKLTTTCPRFWVFMISWKATIEGFYVWSDRNAEWIKTFK